MDNKSNSILRNCWLLVVPRHREIIVNHNNFLWNLKDIPHNIFYTRICLSIPFTPKIMFAGKMCSLTQKRRIIYVNGKFVSFVDLIRFSFAEQFSVCSSRWYVIFQYSNLSYVKKVIYKLWNPSLLIINLVRIYHIRIYLYMQCWKKIWNIKVIIEYAESKSKSNGFAEIGA